ncbi:fimbria/pilus outer membrane usher protein [Proteus faecis]|uniref:fimbria/pilus outer membrane usher protein n=1 Tax=Proteus faecis TaxID=2050967 RepID=UPI0020C125B2
MKFNLSKVRKAVLLAFSFTVWSASATEFNIDVLDAEDIKDVDISQFSVAGYVPPGNYMLSLFVNGQRLGSPREITVFEKEENSNLSQWSCIPKDTLDMLGLTDSAKEKVEFTHDNECLDLSQLTGSQSKVELSSLSLKITIPQTWMEYRDAYWIPPALWENGINGAFIDYSANINTSKQHDGKKTLYLSTSGIAGVNLGVWRFRADYNATYQKQSGDGNNRKKHNFNLSRLYAYTSLKKLASILTVGENYFYSDVFEAWQYSGFSLESDDRMLPPKLVGYAPEITGVANTNATVIVRSKDRVILETTVPPGPFRIQSLESGLRGTLDVTIREENGEERTFSINTASLPYLTRPGRFIYKLVVGKTRYSEHKLTGKPVISGEFSYGLNNEWSLYGGSQISGDYQSVAVGIGRDLFALGALSLDITQSVAHSSQDSLQGRSYRMSYAKSFDSLRTDITFAGYRFADRNYRTLNQFMDEERTGYVGRAPKENYQVYLNKYFDDFSLSLNYQYSTYWGANSQTQYGLYANSHFNVPSLSQQDISVGLSASRTERDSGYKDDAINLYLSIPLNNGQTLDYSESFSHSDGVNQYSHNIGYSGTSDKQSYNVNVGYDHGQNIDNQSSISGYYSYNLSQVNLSANASYVPQQYRSLGASISSGITATTHGISLHNDAYGDTRLIVETPGASGIPIDGGRIKTNMFGLAVLPNVNSYRKTTVSINTSKLPDNVEALESTTDITLTKGAIGYRKLPVIKGEKLFAVLLLNNGKNPPFGSSVRNANNRELGIVGDDGVTWLIGISPKENLSVYWGERKQCEITLPEKIDNLSSMLLLPCQ